MVYSNKIFNINLTIPQIKILHFINLLDAYNFFHQNNISENRKIMVERELKSFLNIKSL